MIPAGVALVVAIAVAALAVVFVSAKASIEANSSGIAKIGMPLGGAKILSVSVIGGREQKLVPVNVTGDPEIVAKQPVPAGEKLKIRVVVKRPGWISWLAGKTQTLTLSYTTPVASVRTPYITLRPGAALKLRFKKPVEAYEYGASNQKLTRKILSSPSTSVTVPHTGTAGTVYVSAQIHKWESSSTAQISYFPAGSTASAVANPSPGSTIAPNKTITISFSKPISKVLGSHMPTLTPAASGSWHKISSHAIKFVPSGYGYGLGAKVQVTLPNGVRLVHGQSGTATSGTWTVPDGSTTRAQQILSLLGYLPVSFKYAGKGVGLTPADQENAAVKPPAGKFGWRYPNTPSQLIAQWQPGASGVVTQGALMMFETDHDMTADGVLGPAVWKALINAVVHDQKSNFGYTFVMVHEADVDESVTVWHNGNNVVETPANTGTASAGGTATGTYPVFEHAPSVTMSGTNPDGSTYVDPGILWVSYFNGGDALHEYPRASYGFPQSDGCVEMPMSAAAAVYPYTPIGALVDVST
jgi:L,D-transpeptidase catalytic domain